MERPARPVFEHQEQVAAVHRHAFAHVGAGAIGDAGAPRRAQPDAGDVGVQVTNNDEYVQTSQMTMNGSPVGPSTVSGHSVNLTVEFVDAATADRLESVIQAADVQAALVPIYVKAEGRDGGQAVRLVQRRERGLNAKSTVSPLFLIIVSHPTGALHRRYLRGHRCRRRRICHQAVRRADVAGEVAADRGRVGAASSFLPLSLRDRVSGGGKIHHSPTLHCNSLTNRMKSHSFRAVPQQDPRLT
jgi:hypothetical protein